MKPVISLKDLEEMARNGQDFASLPADALLTPSARDFMRDREGYGKPSGTAASGAKASTPAKAVNSKSSKAELRS